MIIALQNIQSIKRATYDFGDKGVCVITGDNSNGKSIVFKAIGSIVNLRILDKEERESLINDFAEYGIILIKHLNQTLTFKVHRERNQCVMQLQRADGTTVQRTFREGGIKELIEEFGFCCYGDNSVCLQLYETLGLIPFVNTPNKINGEIVEDMTEDHIAKQFLVNYKETTHKVALEKLKNINLKIDSLKRVKESLVIYDYREYESYERRMQELYQKLQFLTTIKLSKLVVVPSTECVNLPTLRLERLAIPPSINPVDVTPPILLKFEFIQLLPNRMNLSRLGDIISDLHQAEDGVCPTCGRSLVEGGRC